MKTKHQIFFSRKGSIVTSLIALGVITTSTIGFFQYMNQFQANIISTEQAGGQPILMNTILNNMKSLLIENNIDENGIITAQNIHGICSLIKPVSGTRTNEELLIGFSDIKKDPGKNWILERWKVFFPSTEWEIIEDGIECKNIFNENIPSVNENEGSFKRCLKNIPTDSNNVHAAFAIAEIVPEKFNRKENQEHSIQVNSPDQLVDPNDPSSLRGYDPKSIIFRLKTHLAYSSSEEENPHY